MQGHTMRHTSEYSLADAAVRTVFLSMVTLSVLYAAVWMAQDIFPEWILSDRARMWLHGTVIFTAALYEIGIRALPRGPGFLCRLCVPAVYAGIAFRYMKAHQIDLEDGACALAMQFFLKINRHLRTFFSIWRGKPELIGLAFAFWTLVILLGLLLLALVLGRLEMLLLLPAAVFAAELLIGYIPQWKGLALFFAALLFVHADGANGRMTALRVHADKTQRQVQAWYLHWLPAACLAVAAVCILFCSTKLSDATAQRWMDAAPRVQAIQKKAEQGIMDIWGGFFAPRQEAVGNQTPRYTGKEMLRVTASKLPAEDVLLKGFCGTDYRNGSWICDRQKFADACAAAGYEEKQAARELLGNQYDLYAQGAERIMMRYAFGGDFLTVNVGDLEKTDYTVEHTGIQSRYAFLPYAVNYGEQQQQLVSDMTVQKSWRQKTFSYSGWDHFTGGIAIGSIPQERGNQVFSWYDGFAKQAYLDRPDHITTVDEYLESMQKLQEQREELRRALLSSQAEPEPEEPSMDMAEDEGEASPAFSWDFKESRNWLTLKYLQYEAEYIDEPFWRNQNRLQTALALSAALKRYQDYSLELDPLPQGEDPVNYFLMHSRKGYCMHFASAAVLMLRELGVPARYVSGYVVRRSEFRQKGDVYTASVKDRSAHAWAEIYLEQIGWVPIDVTPPAEAQAASRADEGTVQETDTDTEGQETSTDTDDTQTDADDTQTNADDTQTNTDDTQADSDGTQTDTDDTQTDTGQEDPDKPVWQRYSLLLAAAAVLLIILAVYGTCRWIAYLYRQVPRREIKAGKYGRAVRRINWRIYCRMCARGRVLHRNLSDAQYEKMLKTVYQEIAVEDWAEFMRIVMAAAFAENEVTRKDAQFCWHIYQTMRHKNVTKGT